MRPTLRLPLALLPAAACALSLTVWLAAQTPPPVAPPAQPGAGAQPGNPAARGGGQRGQGRGLGQGRGRGQAGPAANTLPYLSQPALGGMDFDLPVDIVAAPPGETNGLYILERTGRIIRIPDVTKPERVVFLDLTGEVGNLNNERGVLALVFHPDYAHNHQFYVWFTVSNEDGSESVDRLARFTTGADGKGDPKSEQPLISQADRSDNHNGGQLLFGPDGYLYASLGDEGDTNGRWGNTQLIDKNFFSGIIRIDVDKRPGSLPPNPHPSVHPGTYTIPADNPWVGAKTFNTLPVDPAKVRTEFWAVGLRNPWRMAFDPETGLLWCADVGQAWIESIDLIRRGGNYGWNFFEAGQTFIPEAIRYSFGPTSPPPADPNRAAPSGATFDQPLYTYYHPGAPAAGTETGQCIIGGFVYRGKAYPALKDHYIFADYNSGWIWSLSPVDGKGGKITVEKIARRSGIVSIGQDPVTGEVLLSNYSSKIIEHLVVNPNPAPATPPAALTVPAVPMPAPAGP
jgi:glucose/arabinose dehydrogenase